MLSRIVLFLAATCACNSLRGATILSVSDPSYLGYGPAVFGASQSGGQYVATSWTSTANYSNVSISVPLQLWAAANESYSGKAYLTKTIGPGTTAAVAETKFTGTNTTAQWTELFSELVLPAGTYYLTLAGHDPPVGPQPGFIWSHAVPSLSSTFQSVTAPGVTLGVPLAACNFGGACAGLDYSFAPASPFAPQSDASARFQQLLLIESSQFNIVDTPEPSAAWLVLIGLAGLAVRRWTRTSGCYPE